MGFLRGLDAEMGAIERFFRKVGQRIKEIWNRRDASAHLLRALAIVDKAFPVVERIAAWTPNRTDDEIVALIRRFRLKLPHRGKALSDDLRIAALQGAALALLREQLDLYGISERDSILRLALEAAYAVWVAEQEAAT